MHNLPYMHMWTSYTTKSCVSDSTKITLHHGLASSDAPQHTQAYLIHPDHLMTLSARLTQPHAPVCRSVKWYKPRVSTNPLHNPMHQWQPHRNHSPWDPTQMFAPETRPLQHFNLRSLPQPPPIPQGIHRNMMTLSSPLRISTTVPPPLRYHLPPPPRRGQNRPPKHHR